MIDSSTTRLSKFVYVPEPDEPAPATKKKRKRKTYNSYVRVGAKKYPMTSWSMSGEWMTIKNGSREQYLRLSNIETFEVFGVNTASGAGQYVPVPVVAGPMVSGGPGGVIAAMRAKAKGEFDPKVDAATINDIAEQARRNLDLMLRAGDGFASS